MVEWIKVKKIRFIDINLLNINHFSVYNMSIVHTRLIHVSEAWHYAVAMMVIFIEQTNKRMEWVCERASKRTWNTSKKKMRAIECWVKINKARNTRTKSISLLMQHCDESLAKGGEHRKRIEHFQCNVYSLLYCICIHTHRERDICIDLNRYCHWSGISIKMHKNLN